MELFTTAAAGAGLEACEHCYGCDLMVWGRPVDLSKPWVKGPLQFVPPSFVPGLNKSALTPFLE